jgi:hypothetical protein
MTDAHEPLPDDWRPPQRILFEREWDRHPHRDELVARQKERDADGAPTWVLREKDEPEDWAAIWQRPLDPRDPRPGIRICGWPNCWLEEEMASARMRAGESSDD